MSCLEKEIKETRVQNPLGYEPIGRLLTQFAVPSVVMLLVNNLYNIVDQIFIGRGVGYLGNAATTVIFPIVTMVLALGLLIGAGGSAYASIKLGEEKFDVAEHVLGNTTILLIVVGIIFSSICFLFLEPLLSAFGATETIMPYAKSYTIIILLGIPFMMMGAGYANMSRADGNPKIAMISMVTGAGLNTLLDPFFIFVLHWGVRGAALATILSQIISGCMLFHFFLTKSNMKIRKKYLKPDWGLIVRFLALGSSSFVLQVANTGLLIVLNNSLVHYGNLSEVGGDVALSAMGIVFKISAILIGINIGIGTGVQPIIGFNFGAKKFERIKSAFRLALGVATIFSVVGWAICVFCPQLVLSVFGSENTVFFDFAVRCMKIFMFGLFTTGLQIVAVSYFQSTGQALKASCLSSLRQVILLIPLILILPLFLGLDGILYAGMAADLGATFIIGIFVLLELKRINRRNVAEEKENL